MKVDLSTIPEGKYAALWDDRVIRVEHLLHGCVLITEMDTGKRTYIARATQVVACSPPEGVKDAGKHKRNKPVPTVPAEVVQPLRSPKRAAVKLRGPKSGNDLPSRDAAIPRGKKKRGRPPGSKNKRKRVPKV